VAAPDSGQSTDALPADASPADLGTPADAAAPDAGAVEDARVMDATVPMDAAPRMDAAAPDSGPPPPFVLTSSAFMNGGAIPAANSCRGVDIQPEVAWTGAPPQTMSFAVVLIDDTIHYVHWVAYNIPPNIAELPEGASTRGQLPPGTMEAHAYGTRYRGPCPNSTHTYQFRVYALDQPMITFTASDPIGEAQLRAAFGNRALGVATMTGTFTP
jgi:Raf kinase inhibitor-like YbhB/YbcL family protein